MPALVNFKTFTTPLREKGDKDTFSPNTNDLHKMERSLGGLGRYRNSGENVTPVILIFVLEGYWRCVFRPVGDGVFLCVICRSIFTLSRSLNWRAVKYQVRLNKAEYENLS